MRARGAVVGLVIIWTFISYSLRCLRSLIHFDCWLKELMLLWLEGSRAPPDSPGTRTRSEPPRRKPPPLPAAGQPPAGIPPKRTGTSANLPASGNHPA